MSRPASTRHSARTRWVVVFMVFVFFDALPYSATGDPLSQKRREKAAAPFVATPPGAPVYEKEPRSLTSDRDLDPPVAQGTAEGVEGEPRRLAGRCYAVADACRRRLCVHGLQASRRRALLPVTAAHSSGRRAGEP